MTYFQTARIGSSRGITKHITQKGLGLI